MILKGFHSFPDNVTWFEHLFLGDDQGRGKAQCVRVSGLTEQPIVTELAGQVPRIDICQKKTQNYDSV